MIDLELNDNTQVDKGETAADVQFKQLLEELQEEIGETQDQMNLTFENVEYKVETVDQNGKKVEKQILSPCSGHFEIGTLTAIMGPSGCGKSTLLDILAAKKTTSWEGNVYVNGHKRTKHFTRFCSYVPQSDYGSGFDTVWESVKFVSEMKAEYGSKAYLKAKGLGKAEVEKEREMHVNQVLAVLALTPIKNSYIGNDLQRGISGGQKRRVTLAKALVQAPSILFCDEPTSGLSATDSQLVMKALRNVCSYLKVTCICVIHQPRLSIFNMFDKLILLSSLEGKVVYNGPREKAADYFAELGYPVPRFTSPPDWFLDLITPGSPSANPEHFLDAYINKQNHFVEEEVKNIILNKGKSPLEILGHEYVKRGTKRNRLTWYEQTAKVTQRGMRLMFRDLTTLLVLFGSGIFLGLMIGLVYLNVRSDPQKLQFQIAFIFTVLITASLMSMNNIPGLVLDRLIFENERAEALYGTFPYMISRLLQSGFTALIENFLLVLICHFMAGFSGELFFYFFILALASFCAIDALVSTVVSISKGATMANGLATLVITILTLFNGFTANTVSSPPYISWICFISPFYYAFWGGINAFFEDYDFSQVEPPFNSYQALLDIYGLQPNYKWKIIGIQFAFTAFFRILQFFALKYYSTLKK